MIKRICILSLFVGMALSFAYAKDNVKPSRRIVLAYVVSGATSEPDVDVITHINYAFGHVNATFDGIRIENEERLHQITALKKKKKTLKVLLSIGGWGSGGFSEMAATDENRKAFAGACREVVHRFKLDGIDIDWEYPSSSSAGISSSATDTDNYTLMMKEIRLAIGKRKLLTLASVAGGHYIDFKAILPYINFVNIMTYDVARPPYHHAPLYKSEMTRGISCQEAVNAHLNAGMPADKLVLGIPFYGRGADKLPDFIDYKAIIALSGYTTGRDENAKVPYLSDSSGKMVCSFDDAESIREKSLFIVTQGLLGAMYWQYDGDDSKGTLRNAVYQGVMQK